MKQARTKVGPLTDTLGKEIKEGQIIIAGPYGEIYVAVVSDVNEEQVTCKNSVGGQFSFWFDDRCIIIENPPDDVLRIAEKIAKRWGISLLCKT